MNVMFTVLYLTFGIHSLSVSGARSCLREAKAYSMDEMERMVYAIANVKGVPPTVILNRLMRKVRYRQRTEKTKPKNPLQDLALQELIGTNHRPTSLESENSRRVHNPGRFLNPETIPNPGIIQPPPVQSMLPPPRIFAPPPSMPMPGPKQSLLPPPMAMPPSGMLTGVFFTPGLSKETADSPSYPSSFYIPIQYLKPPIGVTISVETDRKDRVLPDVTVTFSPMMTTIEALRQAESKYRSFLGHSDDEDVFSFRRSLLTDCYVIASFNDVQTDDRGYWKIVISDRTGKEVYKSVCLPSRSEVPIKSGMTIRLLYTLT